MIEPVKAGVESAVDEYPSPLYGTFGRQQDEYSGYFSSGDETASEQGPLIRASNPCFELPRLINEKQATVLDLLRTPRLPLALIATAVMAIIFSALETVRCRHFDGEQLPQSTENTNINLSSDCRLYHYSSWTRSNGHLAAPD